MRIGITVVRDASGAEFVLSGGKILPVEDIDKQKILLKDCAVKGLKVGGKSFVAGMLVTQHGVDSRKRFPVIAAKG
jgi:hypothetical protein